MGRSWVGSSELSMKEEEMLSSGKWSWEFQGAQAGVEGPLALGWISLLT
jgi:hypothetical protein